MNSKIIFIEGLPGSGKTTYSKKLTAYYKSLGYKVESFEEGDLHPIDLAWCALLSEEEYNKLLKKYNKYNDQLKLFSRKDGNHYILAYTKVRVADEDVSFYSELEPLEIYSIDHLETFKKAHIDLWSKFKDIANDNTIYIFECIFLQNHINELILKYDLSQKEMIQYFIDLLECVSTFESHLYYIEQMNPRETLNNTIEQRRTTKPEVYKDWIDHVLDYFQSTKFGKEYSDKEGFLKYFIQRQNIEKVIINELNIQVHTFNLCSDYDKVFDEMKKLILKST